jgi:hypothetical protein
VFFDDDELNALGQADAGELGAGVLAAILAMGQGDAVDAVEKVPHADGGL